MTFYPDLPGYSAPQIPQWAPSTSYASEDSTEDANSNGVLDVGEDTNSNGQLDVYNGILDPGEDGTNGFPANGRLDGDRVFPLSAPQPANFELYYECVAAGTSGTTEPAWPLVDGQVSPQILGSTPPPTWRAVLNIRPLSAILIRIRFLHVQTNKVRQLTLIHSMND